MKKSGLLNPELLAAAGELGHTDESIVTPHPNVIVVSGVPF